MSEHQWSTGEELLREWLRRAREGQHSHHEAAKYFRRVNYMLAVPVIVITTSLGTAAFATISTTARGGAGNVWFGLLSMLAAVLASLQTYFRYAERSEKHRNIGAQYGSVRRHIEEVLSLPVPQRGVQAEVINLIRNRLDSISNEGEVVSRRIFERTIARLERKDRAGGSGVPAA